ncbi:MULTISPECIES: NADPH-dependent FMN reductase [Dolosigranulum]|uniref:NAD(P)H-dependent oxidoreductase n=1 Tax=Dolosigranulum savutiense TaxID=3110288 RepID=A0AB74TJP9_9LACT|nr:NAD(P)H-dependent oxidoreductase [Dolosigranulum pigrum]QTJ49419.1 NAD(P)H-dependent oxidoreductase [Dolosigranulum pigrum]QTJ51136.1 NAD(P)H-dependent oxidoreductase [Dolosigranulum pigrum]
MTKKIGFIVGSLREKSFNMMIAKKFEDLIPKKFDVIFLEVGNLPLYNEDLDTDSNIPKSWVKFRNLVDSVDGVFFFTPEYNRSMPATIKNALDIGSNPYGENTWNNKPALVLSASQGAIAGFGANHHLRQTLVYLNMPVLQQPEAYIGNVQNLIDDQNNFEKNTVEFFQLIIDKYITFFEKLQS